MEWHHHPQVTKQMELKVQKKHLGLAELKQIATNTSSWLRKDLLVLLEGEVGAGKTTFAHFILQARHINRHLTSPSFCLLNTFRSRQLTINHFDFYRLAPKTKNQVALEREYWNQEFEQGANLIEWWQTLPWLVKTYQQWNFILIKLKPEKDLSKRTISITSNCCDPQLLL